MIPTPVPAIRLLRSLFERESSTTRCCSSVLTVASSSLTDCSSSLDAVSYTHLDVYKRQEVSRARYFDLYDLAPVGYCTLDAAGVVLEVNLTASRMFGVDKDQLVGQPLSDFIHRDSQDCFYRNRRLLQDTPTPRSFELLFQRRAGASFWAWAEIHVARGAQGEALCRVAFTDITMLKQPGAAARRS